MASSTFRCDAAGVVYSGQWLDWVVPTGRSVRQWQGQNTQVDLIAHGSELSLLCNYDDSQVMVQASMDGGSFTPLPGNGGTWSNVTVFSGLPDSAHSVTIKQTSGNQSWLYLDAEAAYTISGAAPAITAPVGIPALIPLNDDRLILEGGWTGQAMAGYSNPLVSMSRWLDATIRFRAKCSSISAWMLLDGSKIRVQIDGADSNLVTANPPPWSGGVAVYGWIELLSGLDASVDREYSFSSACSPYGASAVYAVGLLGGGLTVAPAARTVRIAFYGDSLTVGTAGTGNDSSLGYVHRVGLFAGRHGPFEVCNRAIAGTTVKNSGATRVGDVVSAAPSQVVILYGTNDMTGVDGAETVAEFQAAYSDMLGQIVSALAGAKVFCLGIMPRGDVTVDRTPWSAAIEAAANGAGSKNLVFVLVEGWIDPATDTADGVHPNGSGYAKIATKLEGLLGYDAALSPLAAAIALAELNEVGAIG